MSARKSAIQGLFLAGAIVSATAAFAATAETNAQRPAAAIPKAEKILSSVDAPLSAVTVMGRRARSANGEIWLSRSSASSCAFSPGSVDELYREALAHSGGSRAPDLNRGGYGFRPMGRAGGYYGGAFSSSHGSPWGRSASFPIEIYNSPYYNPSTQFFYGSSAAGWYDSGLESIDSCTQADYNFAASRARIAARDKSLPEGYAAYEAGDYARALTLFQQAYTKLPDNYGGVDAALMLGRIYIERAADPADAPQAAYWLERAGGSTLMLRTRFNPMDPYGSFHPAAEASAMLGKIHLVGWGVPRDSAQAIKWFKRAGDQGHVPATKILGDIYLAGHGVPRDVRRAEHYYAQAAKRGFAPAIFALGEIAYHGLDGKPRNVSKAVGLYNQAAQVGDPKALYALAYAYDAGEAVEADPKAAVGFYKAAALKGSPSAQAAMGTYFYKGEAVEQDLAVARKWFEVAALRGDADGMFNLAVMMARGEGGDRDLGKAYAWMDVARLAGHPNAAQAMTALDGQMNVADQRAAQDLTRPKAVD